MTQTTSGFIYWTPRVLSLLFVAFLALFSLDVFEAASGFWETTLALFMHNIPTLIVLSIIMIAWRYELVGAIGFFLSGIAYIVLVLQNPFKPHQIAWIAQISGIAFFIGAMYLIGWYKKRRKKTS